MCTFCRVLALCSVLGVGVTGAVFGVGDNRDSDIGNASKPLIERGDGIEAERSGEAAPVSASIHVRP
eukprot:5202338-Prymnesium_polylepis.1